MTPHLGTLGSSAKERKGLQWFVGAQERVGHVVAASSACTRDLCGGRDASIEAPGVMLKSVGKCVRMNAHTLKETPCAECNGLQWEPKGEWATWREACVSVQVCKCVSVHAQPVWQVLRRQGC